MLKNKNTYPVDLVYLWCNDADPNWHNKRIQYLIKEKNLDVQATHSCRFASHDELKYSLRSAAKFAPWINHIFIVSDHQTPDWLNLKNPKISMVNHEDILPAGVLPLFNSSAIEIALGNIKNLSEHFLFANDDMFFGNTVTPDFFFTPENKAIVRFRKPPKKKKIARSQYGRYIAAMQKLSAEKLGLYCSAFPHHCIDAYLKSDYAAAMEQFCELAAQTTKQRFREENALQRVIVSYYMLAQDHAVSKIVKDFDEWQPWYQKLKNRIMRNRKPDSFCININSPKGFAKLLRIQPPLFCINDTENKNGIQIDVPEFLEQLFPDKCEFEK